MCDYVEEVIIKREVFDLMVRAVKAKSLSGFVYLVQEYDHDNWNVLGWHTKEQTNDRDGAIFAVGYRVGIQMMARRTDPLTGEVVANRH